jgi:hypothetical protein
MSHYVKVNDKTIMTIFSHRHPAIMTEPARQALEMPWKPRAFPLGAIA